MEETGHNESYVEYKRILWRVIHPMKNREMVKPLEKGLPHSRASRDAVVNQESKKILKFIRMLNVLSI